MHMRRVLFVAVAIGVVSIGLAGPAGAQHPVRLFLEDGTVIDGQPIDPGNPEFTADPGAVVTGSFAFRCENDGPAEAAAEGALSWDPDHQDSYAPFGYFPQGTNHSTFPMERLGIPSAGGTYYMVLCAFTASAPGFVASMTSPTCGTPVWQDGNDIADQNATTLAGAIVNGWATLPVWMCDHMQDASVGAAYITVHVRDLPVGACCIGESPTIECRVTTSSVCSEAGGTYFGDGTLCEPFPCFSPTKETTWGNVRSLYH